MKKKIIKGLVPFLLLFLAMTFMTQFKQYKDLSDTERYEINNFIKENEAAPISASEKKPERNIANSNIDGDEGPPADPNINYAITSDDNTVWVHDDQGNTVFETSLTNWEENWDYYYKKYDLDS